MDEFQCDLANYSATIHATSGRSESLCRTLCAAVAHSLCTLPIAVGLCAQCSAVFFMHF